MDVPGDRSCLFYACISQLQRCTSFTIEQASILRNNLMDYLLLHADDLSGDFMSLTWHTLAMMHASEIQSELRHKCFFKTLSFLLSTTMLITWELPPRIDASMQTHRNYFWSLAGTPQILQYQVDPHSSQQYVLIQEFIGDPMLPTAPLCPFFSLRFAHSLSSLRVFFSVKSSSLEMFKQPFFDVSISKFNLGPMPLWHGAASPSLYAPPPLLF